MLTSADFRDIYHSAVMNRIGRRFRHVGKDHYARLYAVHLMYGKTKPKDIDGLGPKRILAVETEVAKILEKYKYFIGMEA